MDASTATTFPIFILLKPVVLDVEVKIVFLEQFYQRILIF